MALSRLDKTVLRHLLALFFYSASIRRKDFPYPVNRIKKELNFGSDFQCRFDDFYKLVIIRHSIKRTEDVIERYDMLVYFDVQLDNAVSLSKGDPIYAMRAEIAEKTIRRIEKYLIKHGLALELET